MIDLVSRALFLASGQDDPHSVTIIELCTEIERLRTALERISKPTYGTELWMDGEERAEILGGHLFRLQGVARTALSKTGPID